MTTSRIGIFLVLGLLACAGCGAKQKAAAKPPVPEVTVARPTTEVMVDYVEFPGQTAAVGEVEVRARVTGYIVEICFEDGQEVKQGDLLFRIDPRPYEMALDRATGELARLKALAEKAKADLARAERLRPSGAMSQDEFEQHAANLKVHGAWIQTAEAAVREAELNLEFTRITSPIDGRVGRRMVTEGNLVHSGSGDSTVLTTVVTTDPMYVYFNIEEPTLLKYERLGWRKGDDTLLSRIKDLKVPVEIGLADEEGFPHVGVLDFVDNKIDPGTGTIRARGQFAKAKYLMPGMFVRVRLPLGEPHPALLVEERAIGMDQRQRYLLTVNKDNVVEYRAVEVGVLRDGKRVITSGITADDRVIVEGVQRAKPGIMVSPHAPKQAN